jgi:thiamine-monophosphate kinase
MGRCLSHRPYDMTVPDRADEQAFLQRVAQRLPMAGDDLAVLTSPGSGKLLAGIDPVLDGVHVDVATCGHRTAGRKAAKRNLSDVAAMGGRPTALLLSLVVPRMTTTDEAMDVVEGVAEVAEHCGCALVGGDFAVWDGPMVVTVAVLGEAEEIVPRQGARVGQKLFVTGPLGGSILGRHLTFEPKLEAGRKLVGVASAMCDLSDGLSVDLPRLLSGLGATLYHIPIHDDARRLPGSPLEHALHDGEDYELLFAADEKPDVVCIEIGEVEAEPGVRIREEDGTSRAVEPAGFIHGATRETLQGPDATVALGRRLASHLKHGGILRLVGNLGAGKTTLVRGLVEGLGGDPQDVSSPTYVLHQPYPIADGRELHHLDAYRVAGSDDFNAIGFDELLEATRGGDVVVVEWPERVDDLLPADAVTVRLEHVDDASRRVTVEPS